jgi:hypothetical protein
MNLPDLEKLLESATARPWRQGMVSGRCEKPAHGKNGHPGPRGDDPCEYTYRIVADDAYARSQIAVEPNITLIGTDDNGPVLQEKNAALIVAAVNALPELIAIARAAMKHVDLTRENCHPNQMLHSKSWNESGLAEAIDAARKE